MKCKDCSSCGVQCQAPPPPLTDREKIMGLRSVLLDMLNLKTDDEVEMQGLENILSHYKDGVGEAAKDAGTALAAIDIIRRTR